MNLAFPYAFDATEAHGADLAADAAASRNELASER
jgi:hypothetical protein